MTSQASIRRRNQFLIGIADTFLNILAVYLALVIRFRQMPEFNFYVLHIRYFIFLFIYNIAAMYLLNLYALNKPFSFHRTIPSMFGISLTGGLIGFIVFYFSLSTTFFPKTILLLFYLFFSLLVIGFRFILDHYLSGRARIPVIFLGHTDSIRELTKKMHTEAYSRFTTAFIYKKKDSKNTKDLIACIKKTNHSVFVYTRNFQIPPEIQKLLYLQLAQGRLFFSFSEFYEYIVRKIPLEDIDQTWFFNNINMPEKKLYFTMKRGCDILFSITGLCLTLPFWPMIMVLIKADSKGSAFYIQTREGLKSRPFKIIKFRTMRTEQNNTVPTAENDIRVTRIGQFLRSTRIDEIPQLLNILSGSMSLIGPRPERPELAAQLERKVPFYRQRLLVKPGITGWDQVTGEYHSPSVTDTYKKLQNDLYYIKNCSSLLDISIGFKTIITMFSRSGL
jgi:exopolysaccharide biosynthesis polyprenyl glycosylphosphotransferase